MSVTAAKSRPAASDPAATTRRVGNGAVAEPDDEGLNLVVLRGRVSGAPEVRVLPSQSRLVTFGVRVPAGDGTRTSVPVAVWDPPSWLEDVGIDAELVVIGTVRRRFFRSGDATGARVEVHAAAVGRAGDGRRRAALLRRARTELAILE